MRRKIYDRLLQWKREKDGTTALMIEGARRVGKSYIAEEFARNEYDSYILIDFSKAPQRVKDWFDEVQKCPRAREAVKALVADRRFDYLETGSYICRCI